MHMSVESTLLTPVYSHFDESDGRVEPLFNVHLFEHYTICHYRQYSYEAASMIPVAIWEWISRWSERKLLIFIQTFSIQRFIWSIRQNVAFPAIFFVISYNCFKTIFVVHTFIDFRLGSAQWKMRIIFHALKSYQGLRQEWKVMGFWLTKLSMRARKLSMILFEWCFFSLSAAQKQCCNTDKSRCSVRLHSFVVPL